MARLRAGERVPVYKFDSAIVGLHTNTISDACPPVLRTICTDHIMCPRLLCRAGVGLGTNASVDAHSLAPQQLAMTLLGHALHKTDVFSFLYTQQWRHEFMTYQLRFSGIDMRDSLLLMWVCASPLLSSVCSCQGHGKAYCGRVGGKREVSEQR